MATAFDDLAQKVQGELPPGSPQMVTDFLGRQAPLALSGQPTLPSGAGAPTPAAGPTGPGGAGVGTEAPKSALLAAPEGARGDVLGPVDAGGGGGAEGPGIGPTVGANVGEASTIPGLNIASLGLGREGPFGSVLGTTFGQTASPSAQVNLGASPLLSVTPFSVNTPEGRVANSAANSLLGFVSKTLGVAIPSLLSWFAPAVAGAAGPAGIALGFPALVNNILAFTHSLGLTPETFSSQFSTISHDLANAQTPEEAEAAPGQWNAVVQELEAGSPGGGAFSSPER